MKANIRYTLGMPMPSSHELEVTMTVDGIRDDFVDLAMPAWAPGSYKIRDYARHVVVFAAGGRRWEKIAKDVWRVHTAGARSLTIRYTIYAAELGVRNSHLDDEHAHINGTSVFFYVRGRKEEPHLLRIEKPAVWKIATGLDPAGRNTFVAPDYDVLVDCPIELGTFREWRFRFLGKLHRVVIHGDGNYDGAQLVKDLRKIVAVGARMFGGLPYKHYTFIIHASPAGGGGLEHLNSTSIIVNPSTFRPRDKYERFLDLAAHEYFHLWNVKRIRPMVLGPFDYRRENHTRLLWVMEGLTTYYSPRILLRAGIISAKTYLKKLADQIREYRKKPGRLVQSLEESSYDAWIKFYNPNENSVNAEISYYEKGMFAGLLLDIEIRRRTRGRKSLDDVMRRLYRRSAAKGVGFPEDAVQKTAEELAGGGLAVFFRDWIASTKEMPFERYLRSAGLEIVREPKKPKDGEVPPRRLAHLGIQVEKQGDNRLLISRVIRATAAWRDGLNAGDELIAIDGYKTDAENWEKRIEEKRPGSRVAITLFRRGRLRAFPVTLDARANVDDRIRPVAKPTALQKSIAAAWLGTPWKTIGKL